MVFEHGSQYDSIPNVASIVISGVSAAPKSVTNGDETNQLSFISDFSTETLYVVLAKDTNASEFSVKINF